MTGLPRFSPFGPDATGTLTLPANAQEMPCKVDLWRSFHREKNLSLLGLRRLKVLLQSARSFPESRVLWFEDPGTRLWAVYFCYAPDGVPHASHRFTIDRLRAEGFSILVVCATPDPDDALKFRDLGVNGVIWKSMRGYDFSGYSVGLQQLAQSCGRVDVLVLNDSVLGPFHALRPALDSSPWDLTGFMSGFAIEHHIQSFAFFLRDFDLARLRALGTVFLRRLSFDHQGAVSLLQETRLASALIGRATVGSLATPDQQFKQNYCLLSNPKGLLDVGFPFLKQSIFGKFAERFDQKFYSACLEEYGHPVVAK